MQRYEPKLIDHGMGPLEADYAPNNEGDFVKYSDAESLERRVKVLEEALLNCIEVLESVHHEIGYACDGTRCPEGKAISKARKALESP